MEIYRKIRGTQESVPSLEVNEDTVYIRDNIVKIESDDFVGWEYNETQYTLREYQELIGYKSTSNEEYVVDVDFRLSLIELGL